MSPQYLPILAAALALPAGLLPRRSWRRAATALWLATTAFAATRTTLPWPLVLAALAMLPGLLPDHLRLRLAAWALQVLCLGGWWGLRNRVVFETYACRATPPAVVPAPALQRPAWAPPQGVQLLVDVPGQVLGTAQGAEALATWSGDDLLAWKDDGYDRGLRYRRPDSGDPIEGAWELRVRLRPGPARRLRVMASPRDEYGRVGREAHTLTLPLERGQQTVEVVVPIGETLLGNWESDESSLLALELVLPGGRPGETKLEQVDVVRRGVALEGPAGTARVEADRVIRPSWYVRGGVSVQLAVDVPAGASELRWHDGALGPSGARRVRLVPAEGEPFELATDDGQGWTPQRVALTPWAGQRVTLELSTAGEGIGLFGDPRVVAAAPSTAPDVIVYLVDTLRADHLAAWGGSQPTPAFDRLADAGLVFDRAISASSWTKPTIPTVMTGVLPTTHQVGVHTLNDKLPEGVDTLQGRFRRGGWRTVSVSASPHGSTLSALDRDFSAAYPPRHWAIQRALDTTPTSDQLHRALLDWWDEEPDQPILAYVHTLDVHQFFMLGSDQKRTHDKYLSAIAEQDRLLGQLLDTLAARDSERDLLFVLLSDHGQSFDDHGYFGHGSALFQSQVHVPLVMSSPGRLPAGRIQAPVSLSDLAPTLLDLMGLAPLEEADGHSLLPLLQGAALDRLVPSALLNQPRRPDAPRQYALIDPDGKKVQRIMGMGDLSFDLQADPCERRPASPALDGALDAWIAEQKDARQAWIERHGDDAKEGAQAEDLQLLKTLGYVE